MATPDDKLVSHTREDMLSAMQLWLTFEYLTPQERPKAKCEEEDCVWEIDPQVGGDTLMPWADPEKISDLRTFYARVKNHRFQFFAGTISGEELVQTVRQWLGAKISKDADLAERSTAKDIASFVLPVDKHGHVTGEVFVSAVPWAMAQIQKAQATPDKSFDFRGFFGMDGVEAQIKKAVRELLLKRRLLVLEDEALPDDEGERDDDATSDDVEAAPETLRKLTSEDIHEIATVVFEACGWAPTVQQTWAIKVQRASEDGQGKDAEDPLNSFFAEDLERIYTQIAAGREGPTLNKFLSMKPAARRVDLEAERGHLIEGVHPSRTPLACWPGSHPLVTAQQFAVNTIMRDLADGGLFSVNGPPGTGKTTMLKDIVAGVICQRAEALAAFDNPNQAFEDQIDVDGIEARHAPWRLHDSLRGMGIVVACNGNVAAENISAELPGKKTIDKAFTIDYFSEVANSMDLPKKTKKRGDKRWGLASTPLGNSSNRNKFVRDFWYGTNKTQDDRDAEKKAIEAHKPLPPDRLMSMQNWIRDMRDTVPSWHEARQAFDKALTASKEAQAIAVQCCQQLAKFEACMAQLPGLHLEQAKAEQLLAWDREALVAKSLARTEADADLANAQQIVEAVQRADVARSRLTNVQDGLQAIASQKPPHTSQELHQKAVAADQQRNRVHQALQVHAGARPGFFESLIFGRRTAQWHDRHTAMLDEFQKLGLVLTQTEAHASDAQQWEARFLEGQEKAAHAVTELGIANAALSRLGADAGRMSLATAQADAQSRVLALEACNKAEWLAAEAVARSDARFEGITQLIDQAESEFATARDHLAGSGLLDAKCKNWHLHHFSRDVFHKASPYQDSPGLFDARRALFVAAMDLHKAFIVHSWSRMRPTLNAAIQLIGGQLQPRKIDGGPMALWDALFMVVPLVSTTFASFPRLFRGVGREDLAWVLIDEAGQATPQACVGALWRAKRAVIVGDPIQLEPVVGMPEELVKPLQNRCGAKDDYIPPMASVQTMADVSNQYGTLIRREGDPVPQWLGSPLVVHRRCLDPMFSLANAIAYNGAMVYGTKPQGPGHPEECSQWIHVPAREPEGDGHWISAQGSRALQEVKRLAGQHPLDEEGHPKVYVISPFKTVSNKMRELLRRELRWSNKDVERLCGTVHTFQGKEADDVIFLLGGNPTKPGVINFYAGAKPNLVNVAVTRAKRRLFVIGDRHFWTDRNDSKGYYKRLGEFLDEHVGEASIAAEVTSQELPSAMS